MMQQAVRAEIVNHENDEGDEYGDTDSVQGVKNFGSAKEKKKSNVTAKDGIDEKQAGKKRTCTIF